MVGVRVSYSSSPCRLVRTLVDTGRGRFWAQERGWGLQVEEVLHLSLLVELLRKEKDEQ